MGPGPGAGLGGLLDPACPMCRGKRVLLETFGDHSLEWLSCRCAGRWVPCSWCRGTGKLKGSGTRRIKEPDPKIE